MITNCCTPPPCNTCPPSPTPPWHRPVQSPNTQEINESTVSGGISLNTDVTYLHSEVPLSAGDLSLAYQVALPDGNYKRQIHRIMVRGDVVLTTAAFEVTSAKIVGASKLRFSNIAKGMNAVIEWDGYKWHVIGGNAEIID